MKLLANFRRMPPDEKRLALHCFMIVWLVRIGLWTLPLKLLRRWMDRTKRNLDRSLDAAQVARLSGMIEFVSRRIPRATCLTQALALQTMLARRGTETSLRLGVARDDRGRFRAHAWLEQNGAVLIGGEEATAGGYVPLPQC
jgi:hypothetical protein